MSSLNTLKSNWFNLLVLVIVLGFLWLFNHVYITALLLGCIVATLTFPLFRRLKRPNRLNTRGLHQSMAAIITIIVVSLLILTLTNIFIGQILLELPKVELALYELLMNLPNNTSLTTFLGLSKEDAQILVLSITAEISKFQSAANDRYVLINNILSSQNLLGAWNFSRRTFAVVFDFLVNLIVFLLAWYYSLTSGPKWKDNIFALLPLKDHEKESINSDVQSAIRNVVYANLLSGCIHAGVGFVLLSLMGVPNVFILTMIIFLIGLLPLSPSELGYAAVIFFAFQKSLFLGFGLIVICELIILWVNYILTPKVISGSEEGNPLLILTSILSGISLFGLMGFIIAPVIMILVQSLYRIVSNRLSQLSEINS